MNRPEISEELKKKTRLQLGIWLDHRVREKGSGAFVSPHEGLGAVAEEVLELTEAVQSNDPVKIRSEAFDLAVAAVWMAASIAAEGESE